MEVGGNSEHERGTDLSSPNTPSDLRFTHRESIRNLPILVQVLV